MLAWLAEIEATVRTRQMQDAEPVVMAQLDAIQQKGRQAWTEWREAAQDVLANDPEQYGPMLDRIHQLALHLRGVEWIPGVSGAPIEEALH